MRTNIEIDDDLMVKAMQAGPYKTKKEAVEAGLKLLARQAAYREILKWEGKLQWDGDDEVETPTTGGKHTRPVLAAREASRNEGPVPRSAAPARDGPGTGPAPAVRNAGKRRGRR
jgi:Arc/MetJ family transcription regulator